MKIIREVSLMRSEIVEQRLKNRIVGLVPTMGYLHEGHLELVRRSLTESETTVVSVFVNPAQFGPNEDFDSYPRNEQRDFKLLENLGVDYVFAPSASELYHSSHSTYVEVERLTDYLCGAKRPGHFRGVATIVTKLFNIVWPNRAYFGQKDAQQFRVLKRMVLDLNMDIEMVEISTVREEDGLAMSSRNNYLSRWERREALLVREALERGLEMSEEGVTDAQTIRDEVAGILRRGKHVLIDYVEVVDEETLKPVDKLQADVILAVAVFVGKTRLIDNEIIRAKK